MSEKCLKYLLFGLICLVFADLAHFAAVPGGDRQYSASYENHQPHFWGKFLGKWAKIRFADSTGKF